jgi:predicted enzyme related to lactoylglutathione lyase
MSSCDGVGALVLFSADPERCVAFYRAIGVPLAEERHGEGEPLHFACELGEVHVAVFPAEPPGDAPGLSSSGCTFAGFSVASVEAAVDGARQLGAAVLQEPADYPWGRRAVLRDPDGRPVEVFARP